MKKQTERKPFQKKQPSKSAKQYNAEIQVEINQRKVDIDKSVFEKSAEERLELKEAKKHFHESGNFAGWLKRWGKPNQKLIYA